MIDCPYYGVKNHRETNECLKKYAESLGTDKDWKLEFCTARIIPGTNCVYCFELKKFYRIKKFSYLDI